MSFLVYIAGPYTNPDPCENTHRAVKFGHQLWDHCQAVDADWYPLVPHLSHFWHTMRPRPYEDWLAIDLAFLDRCDAVIRLPGASSGADGEIARAELLGIPTWFVDPDASDDAAVPLILGWFDNIVRRRSAGGAFDA